MRLAATGLLATTGALGLGLLGSTSLAGASTLSRTSTGSSDTATDTPAVGNPNTGTQNVVGSPAVTENSNLCGTFGIGSKTTYLSTYAGAVGTVRASISFVATLTDEYGDLSGQCVTFTFNGSSCTGITDSSGVATCTLNAAVTSSTRYTAYFAGSEEYCLDSSSATGYIERP